MGEYRELVLEGTSYLVSTWCCKDPTGSRFKNLCVVDSAIGQIQFTKVDGENYWVTTERFLFVPKMLTSKPMPLAERRGYLESLACLSDCESDDDAKMGEVDEKLAATSPESSDETPPPPQPLPLTTTTKKVADKAKGDENQVGKKRKNDEMSAFDPKMAKVSDCVVGDVSPSSPKPRTHYACTQLRVRFLCQNVEARGSHAELLAQEEHVLAERPDLRGVSLPSLPAGRKAALRTINRWRVEHGLPPKSEPSPKTRVEVAEPFAGEVAGAVAGAVADPVGWVVDDSRNGVGVDAIASSAGCAACAAFA